MNMGKPSRGIGTFSPGSTRRTLRTKRYNSFKYPHEGCAKND
jgi:hypothetical protein